MPPLNNYRFSIFYNVLEMRPELVEKILPLLKEAVNTQQNIYEIEMLKKFEPSHTEEPIEKSPDFKETIVARLLTKIHDRSNLEGREIKLSTTSYYDLAKLIKWPKPDPILVESLVKAIDSKTVLFIDKRDYLKFLGVLVRRGPLSQAKIISKHAMRWLIRGIEGKPLIANSGGPLSRTQIHGFDEYKSALFYLVEECALRYPAAILMDLVDWIPFNLNSLLPQFASNLLLIELALINTATKKSDQIAAILAGLADTTASLSIEDNALHIIRTFEYIVLVECKDHFASTLAKDKIWCRIFLNQWIARLTLLSNNPSPEVRECVARIVTRWLQSDLPQKEELIEIRDRLSQDCRLRVRNAIDFAGQEEKNKE